MTTLNEIRKQLGQPGHAKLKSRPLLSELGDLMDPCVLTCPSGLVVRVKPMTIKDEYYLEKLLGQPVIRSIAEWLRSRTEVLDHGPYRDMSADWMDLASADFEAICTATKEAE